MKRRFIPNINDQGRWVRALWAVAIFVGAGFAWRLSPWLALGLALVGAFVLFEALRGWCALRACGIKTRL